MPRIPRHDEPGGLYHAILRAVLGIPIFGRREDRRVFLEMVRSTIEWAGLRCLAWALLDNHVHLVLQRREVSLSRAVHRLATRYAKYYNWRRHGKGHVFQGRYVSKRLDSDQYLLEVVRYVLLNPVRAGVVGLEELVTHPWCALPALLGTAAPSFESVEDTLRLLHADERQARTALMDYLTRGLTDGTSLPDLASGVTYDRLNLLGGVEFISRLLANNEEPHARRARLEAEGWTLDRLLDDVCQVMTVSISDVRSGKRGHASRARAVIAFLGRTELGLSLTRLADALGVSPPAICRAVARGRRTAECLGLRFAEVEK